MLFSHFYYSSFTAQKLSVPGPLPPILKYLKVAHLFKYKKDEAHYRKKYLPIKTRQGENWC